MPSAAVPPSRASTPIHVPRAADRRELRSGVTATGAGPAAGMTVKAQYPLAAVVDPAVPEDVEARVGGVCGCVGLTAHHFPYLSVMFPVTWPLCLSPVKVYSGMPS